MSGIVNSAGSRSGVIGTAGQGITFGGDPDSRQNSPDVGDRTLYDYEEGVWLADATPSSSGSINLSSYSKGSYVKIGSIVHAGGQLYLNGVSSPVGYITISLPFSVADLIKYSNAVPVTLHVQNCVSANVADFTGHAVEGTSDFRVYLGDSNDIQSDSAQELKAASSIYFSVSYRAS